MTLDEFNALKPGDKVGNVQGHTADVIAAGDYGVQVQWGGKGPAFTLYRQGRIWVTMDVVPEERRDTCPDCGSTDAPNHNPGCTSPLASS